MPICILLVPEAASQEAKLGLMGKLSSHIHEAYPVTTDLGTVRIVPLAPGAAPEVRYTVRVESDARAPLAQRLLESHSLTAKATYEGVEILGTTHIFVREASGSDIMLAGSLASELPSTDVGRRGARVCFLICPPGVQADAKKTMMEKLTADISDAYPGSDDVFIIHREDEPANVMLNGRLQSESPKFRQTAP